MNMITLGMLLAILSHEPMLASRDLHKVCPVGSGAALIGAPRRCVWEAQARSMAQLNRLLQDLGRTLDIAIWEKRHRPLP
jgi:hypothetical protein